MKIINHLDIEKTKEYMFQVIKPLLIAMEMDEKNKKALKMHIRKGQIFSFLCPCVVVCAVLIFLLQKNSENVSNYALFLVIFFSVCLCGSLGTSFLLAYNNNRDIYVKQYLEKHSDKFATDFINQFQNTKTAEELLKILEMARTFVNKSDEDSFACFLIRCQCYSIYDKIHNFIVLEHCTKIVGYNVSNSTIYFDAVDEQGNIIPIKFLKEDIKVIQNVNLKEPEFTLYDYAKLELKIPYNTPERALVIPVDGSSVENNEFLTGRSF